MEKTLIKTGELGSTGLEITRVGFGAWAIGGGGNAASLELGKADLDAIEGRNRS